MNLNFIQISLTFEAEKSIHREERRMPPNFLDLTSEISMDMRDHPVMDNRAWLSGDINPSD